MSLTSMFSMPLQFILAFQWWDSKNKTPFWNFLCYTTVQCCLNFTAAYFSLCNSGNNSASGLINLSFWSRLFQVIPWDSWQECLTSSTVSLGRGFVALPMDIMVVFLSFHQLHLFPGVDSGFLIILGEIGPCHLWLPDRADKTDLSNVSTQAASRRKGCGLWAVRALGELN